jgi:hypothetical protein
VSGTDTLFKRCEVHDGKVYCSGPIPDAGVVTIGANGSSVSVDYDQPSTPAELASALCTEMNSSFPVHCTGTTALAHSVNMNVQASVNYPISVTLKSNYDVGIGFEFAITGAFNPAYYILSVVYAPPGNHSSNGFTNTTSTGATTSIGANFSQGTSTNYSASGGLLGESSFGVTFGVSTATGNTQAFQVTYQQGSGSQVESTEQAIDHTQDQFFLWINPVVPLNSTITGAPDGYTTSATVASFSMGTPNGEPMDIVNVNAAGLMKPSLIPLDVLLPQTPLPGVTEPGLASICAHPLPPSECTQANACGCVPGDFALILKADPLIGTSQTTPPSQIDSQRYVLVDSQILEGPAQAGEGPVLNTFMQSDSNVTSQTETEMQTNSTAYMTSSGIDIPFLFTFKITDTTTFMWTNTESQGEQNGAAHTAMVTLGSSNVGCFEHVDIYEDTAYHTYAFAFPTTPPTDCQ